MCAPTQARPFFCLAGHGWHYQHGAPIAAVGVSSYFASCKPGEGSQALMCEPVSACHAFRKTGPAQNPVGLFSPDRAIEFFRRLRFTPLNPTHWNSLSLFPAPVTFDSELAIIA